MPIPPTRAGGEDEDEDEGEREEEGEEAVGEVALTAGGDDEEERG